MATPKLIALAAALSPLVEAFSPSAEASASPADHWVLPQGLPEGHNGGHRERLTAPAAGKQESKRRTFNGFMPMMPAR